MDAYKNLFLIISAPTNGKHKLLFPNDNTNVALVTDIKTGWLKKKNHLIIIQDVPPVC